MFTGIIESLGIVKAIEKEGENIHLTITSSISKELKIDQSVAHNGVCLTVVACDEYSHVVTAIQETLDKTNLSSWKVGEAINLERAMKLGDRLDGHIVQGHVDQIATCIDKVDQDGSWLFTFEYDKKMNNITIEKGSITVNGTSLTVVNSGINTFSVAIIPYTYEHTVFKNIIIGSIVNLEFDVIGKYVTKLASLTN
ncbi:riboflavin synthase [Flavobacterium sp.]|jgi:riboflavin synthase|uniref:riboflavin synthase n=1 Tax=Flavobacterium sp. TaxID=239 RepID=UPI0025B98CEF|nr:riboflavin synthase [Flavobacterium sp.]